MATRYSAKLGREEMERRRLAAGRDLLRAGGKRGAQARVAAKYGVSTATANRWHKLVQKGGVDTLRRSKAKGGPPRLTSAQRKKLRRMLIDGALVHGFDTDIWTGKRVAHLIKEKFNVVYSWKYVPELLHDQLGFSVQKPNRRPRELDEEKVKDWLRNSWAQAKKGRSKRTGASGSSMNPARP